MTVAWRSSSFTIWATTCFSSTAGRLGDPRHVAVAAGQLGVGLHGHEVDEVLAVLVRHLVRRLDALPALDPGQQPRASVIAPPAADASGTASPFHHPHRLAFAARDGLRAPRSRSRRLRPRWPRRRSRHLRRQRGHAGCSGRRSRPTRAPALGRAPPAPRGVGKASRAVHHELVVRGQVLHGQQRRLELGGIDVDALDDRACRRCGP